MQSDEKQTTQVPACMICSTFIAVTFLEDGRNFIVESQDHDKYVRAIKAYKEGDWTLLRNIVDVQEAVASTAQAMGCQLVDGVVFYNGVPMHNVVTERILDFASKGLPTQPLQMFMAKVLANPSHLSVDNVYRFMEHNKTIPLDLEGDLIAFKKVDENFRSYHPSKDGEHLDHTPGKEVSMPRAEVDPNPENTCSSGLHFCSRDYLGAYAGCSGKVVLVKVSPEDIVAVPPDYNNAKVRCCRYRVLREVTDEEVRRLAFGSIPLFEESAFEGVERDYDDEDTWDEEFDDGAFDSFVEDLPMDAYEKLPGEDLLKLYEWESREQEPFNNERFKDSDFVGFHIYNTVATALQSYFSSYNNIYISPADLVSQLQSTEPWCRFESVGDLTAEDAREIAAVLGYPIDAVGDILK